MLTVGDCSVVKIPEFFLMVGDCLAAGNKHRSVEVFSASRASATTLAKLKYSCFLAEIGNNISENGQFMFSEKTHLFFIIS